MNLLDNTTNQPSKFGAKNWAEINDDSRRVYNTNSQIKFKTSILKSNLCDYSDAYINVKGTMTSPNTGTPAALNNRNIKVVFKICPPLNNYISEINNTQVDNEYSEIHLKTSGSLWQYYKDEPVLNNASGIIDFPASNDNNVSFKFKEKIGKQAMMAQKILK